MLYIVSTPIGNLEDMTFRAISVLKLVDVIAAEDTRHSLKLLQHFNIPTPSKLISFHDHNTQDILDRLLGLLKQGLKIALISDAGTPLISDPGYPLVKAAHDNQIKVIPVPGACAAICALSVSGLPSDKFVFEGFLPPKKTAKLERLQWLKRESRTMIFYEAPHRLKETLDDLLETFGEQREIVLAREMTKTFETIHKNSLTNLVSFVEKNPEQLQGECVLVVAGAPQNEINSVQEINSEKLLKSLLECLPLKQAVKITADVMEVSKNDLYGLALSYKKK